MAELKVLLQQNVCFQSELMRTFLSSASTSSMPQNNDNDDNTKGNHGTGGVYTTGNLPSDINQTIQYRNNQNTGTNVNITGTELDNQLFDKDNNAITTPMVDNVQTVPETSEITKLTETKTEPTTNRTTSDNKAGVSTEVTTTGADRNANEIEVERIMEEVKQVPSALRQQLIEHVIASVSKAHLDTVTPTRTKVNEVNDRLANKIQEGNMPDLPKLNINPNHMWQKFVQNMTYEISQAVQFCKKLPGFSEIPQDDQMILIKKGSFEILMCRMCLLIDHVRQEMLDPSMEMKCPRSVVKGMPMGHFFDEFFSVASQLNPVKLTDEELGIFSAALMMCPEREGLGNVSAIKKLNALFMQSLFTEMRNNHNDYENKFARLLSAIPVLKSLNRQHSSALNEMKMQNAPEVKDLPDLQREVFDLKDQNSA